MRATFNLNVSKNAFKRAGPKVRANLALVMDKVAHDVEAGAQANIVQQDLIDTGAGLLSVVAIQVSEHTWKVIVGQYYMIFHEFGTVHLPARPFFGPAVDAARPGFVEAVKQAIADSVYTS